MERVPGLAAVFHVNQMRRAWKTQVRDGLRRQPLPDLHDFLDVHRNLEPYLEALRDEVLSGQYRPQPAELALLEKRNGVPRRLSIPAPADAILLQTVVTALEKAILSSQPHSNAFYSRTHPVRGPQHVDSSFAYAWWELWPQFQQRIWKFIKGHSHLVVTDLANYFDCIPLAALRNRIAACGAFSEEVVNFLFFLLDAFTWRPFYLPSSGVGLPQINFDAPRLLAHAYLFPVDEKLKDQTRGDFVRWMDDINCGVDSIAAARELLRELELKLGSLGVRLNSAKTQVLSARDACEYFWIAENRKLTLLTSLVDSRAPEVDLRKYEDKAQRLYRAFRKARPVGQWEKVVKRYFTLFGKLRSSCLESSVPSLLRDQPGLRSSVFRYYTILGPSRRRMKHLSDFLEGGSCLDDDSLFGAIRTLIAWRGQRSGKRRTAIVRLVETVQNLGSRAVESGELTSAGVSAGVWLLAKYGTPLELSKFLRRTSLVWTRSPWAGRQVAAASALLRVCDEEFVREKLTESRLAEPLQVIESIRRLLRLTVVDKQLRKYLLHKPEEGYCYPLEKVLIARVVLRSKVAGTVKSELLGKVRELAGDPCYTRILKRRH
ncbi:MAG: hypothetical protein U0002_09280 [Thermoanaerobaculia bacterium]